MFLLAPPLLVLGGVGEGDPPLPAERGRLPPNTNTGGDLGGDVVVVVVLGMVGAWVVNALSFAVDITSPCCSCDGFGAAAVDDDCGVVDDNKSSTYSIPMIFLANIETTPPNRPLPLPALLVLPSRGVLLSGALLVVD